MSLLNQMLNDLEQRRAEASGTPAMHREIRALPAARSLLVPRLLAATVVVLLSVVGGVWWWLSFGPGRPLPVVPGPIPAQAGELVLPATTLTEGARAELPLRDEPPLSVVSPGRPLAPSGIKIGATLRLSDRLSLTPEADSTSTPSPTQTFAPADKAGGAVEKRALELNPREQAERLYRSAVTQLSQGREQDGIETLKAALRDDPDQLAARQLLIKIHIDRRAFDLAQNELDEGLKRLPKQTAWAMLLARLRIDRADYVGALAVLERHETYAGSAADYQGALAAALQRLNRQADAELRFARATQSEPASGRWWLGLGMAREAQGKSAEAREAFRTALASNGLSAELKAFAEAKIK